MSIPSRNDKIWEKLASGAVNHKFELFAANMAINRAVRNTSSSPGKLAECAASLYEFFKKYENMTSHEFKAIR